MQTRVEHLVIEVRGPDGGMLSIARDALESAVRRALDRFDRRHPTEVLVLREIAVAMRAFRVGPASPDWETAFDRILEAEIERALGESKPAPGEAARVSRDAAWFASEGVYYAEAALAEPNDRWPFHDLAGERAWSALESSSRATIADALAHVARRATHSLQSADDMLDALERTLARFDIARIATVFRSGGDPTAATALLEIEHPIASVVLSHALRAGTSARRRLAALAVLFFVWPPARTMRLPIEQGEVGTGALEPAMRSRAAGLLLAAHLCSAALERLTARYDERALRAVRWAIARAIAHPRVAVDDPGVLLFALEEPAARLSADALTPVDPEPLHACALEVGASMHDGALRVWRSADTAYAMAGEVCADAIPTGDATELALARRYERRTGLPPTSIVLAHPPMEEDVRLVMDVDLPALADAWRPAVRAFASVLRVELASNARVELESLRAMDATLVRRSDRWVVSVSGPAELLRLLPARWLLGRHDLDLRRQ